MKLSERHAHFHEHMHRHHRFRRMGPMGRYVRSRLRRRLFAWFGGAIVSTAIAVFITMSLMGGPWERDYQRIQSFVGTEVGKDWNDVAKRDARMNEVATALEADIELRTVDGQVISRIGEPCDRPGFKAAVLQGTQAVGEVRACFSRQRTGLHYAPWRMLFVMFVAILFLWGASGRIARRIARPLDELTDVVKRLGSGDYSARSQVSRYEPDEIGVVSEAVNDMATKIQKQVSDQRELLATVSHELRTPLARMRIISEIARDTGAAVKTWDDIDREVVEMDALVGELLASSRLEFEAVAKRPLVLKDTAGRAVERAGLGPEKLKVETQRETVEADPTLLARALANLLENARKHAGGAEQLLVRDEPGALVFEVHDRGPGLPQGGETGVFEAFAKGSDTRGEGLGLGLALVKRIAEAHKGSAFALNREGGGATVGVRLPA